jgi:hypothetical protein
MLRWYKCAQTGDIPVGRDSHSASVAGSYIYFFGGQDNDENIHDDFFRAKIRENSDGFEEVELKGQTVKVENKVFTVEWLKIELRKPGVDHKVPWPIKRSSHTMNLFLERFLVVIGGETSNDYPQLMHPKKKVKSKTKEP